MSRRSPAFFIFAFMRIADSGRVDKIGLSHFPGLHFGKEFFCQRRPAGLVAPIRDDHAPADEPAGIATWARDFGEVAAGRNDIIRDICRVIEAEQDTAGFGLLQVRAALWPVGNYSHVGTPRVKGNLPL
jgi:hypothetical protein